jgi:hypothetical protein
MAGRVIPHRKGPKRSVKYFSDTVAEERKVGEPDHHPKENPMFWMIAPILVFP